MTRVLLPIIGLLFCAASAYVSPKVAAASEPISGDLVSVVEDGRLTVTLIGEPSFPLPELTGSDDGLTLTWGGGSRRFSPDVMRTLREVRSNTHLRIAGTVHSDAPLALQAPTLSVVGRLSAPVLDLELGGVLEVESEGALVASGGLVAISADFLSLVGAVEAPGGTVRIRARAVLHAGPITVDGDAEHSVGRVEVSCERFVGTSSGVILARSPEGQGGVIHVVASTRIFTSGSYVATGTHGGRVWLSGADTRLVAATLDASGFEQGGAVCVGTQSDRAQPGQESGWNANEILATAHTRLRAAGAAGSGGVVVVGANTSTAFSGVVQVCGLLGAGGSVELSASGNLSYTGRIEAGGASDNGRVLLDPQDLVLDDATGVLAQYDFIDPNPDPAVGEFGRDVEVLPSGNVVVTNPRDDLVAFGSGACYLFNGATGALISSLIGSDVEDRVGLGGLESSGVTLLTNGNYLVSSRRVTFIVTTASAVTWASGVTGATGQLSANPTVTAVLGALGTGQDHTVVPLSNGNAVALFPQWSNDKGAATWIDGGAGTSRLVNSPNSLVGPTEGCAVGRLGALELTNGNYVVLSPLWDSATAADVGAVTWASGAGVTVGVVGATNSLVGSTADDSVGALPGPPWTLYVYALSNGNYVVGSPVWTNVLVSNAGAVTWCDGTTGTVGAVSDTNSLVGTSADDFVGFQVAPLSNGNYVVGSVAWDGFNGAATWGSGTVGVTGPVSSLNSLVGAGNLLGIVTALSNGNYVVTTAIGNSVTWVDGTTGITGGVTATNSLIGPGRLGGDNIVALSNGHCVFASQTWGGNRGAVTWMDGTQVTTGSVSAANSLVGTGGADFVGAGGLTALSNGNYLVSSPEWDSGGNADVGAVTWRDGTQTTTGTVSATNSLVGGNAGDKVGELITALTNGNYVVGSPTWSGARGALTWGDGTAGIAGILDATNSLVGSTLSDGVGLGDVIDLGNGLYASVSTGWDDGGAVNAGAWTLASDSRPTIGPVSQANSLVGGGPLDAVFSSSGLGDALVAGFVNKRLSAGFYMGSSAYGLASGQSITTTSDRIVALLSAGTDVTLQASQDLTIRTPLLVNNPSGNGGTLTLSAGRRVLIEADVTTDGGDLIVIAGDTLANGVVNADRGAGDAQIANTATISAGTGAVHFETRDGAGLTNTGRTDYALGTINAASVVVVPFADSFSPASAVPTSTVVTVVGGALNGTTGVTVGGVAANLLTTASNQITFTVGASTLAGPRAVVVSTPSGLLPLGDVVVTYADLAVTKTVDQATPPVGSTIVYTVTVSNGGASQSDSVALTDALPVGVTFVSANASQGSFDSGSGVWSVGTLASAASATLALTCTVDPGTVGNTIVNTTSGLSGTSTGGSAADDVGAVSITVAGADLAVSKTVDRQAPLEGETIVYTIEVLNKGPVDSGGVELIDALPAGLTFVSANASQGSYDTGSGLWSVGALPNGARATLLLECTVNRGTLGTGITNTTSGLAGTDLGGSTLDDADSVTIFVASPVVISAIVRPLPDVGGASPRDTYEVTVTYSDASLIDLATVGPGDVTVYGPGGFLGAATIVSTTPSTTAREVTVVYAFTPPGGTWDGSDQGTYTVYAVEGEVLALNGNTAAPNSILGTFRVFPSNTTTSKSEGCSLGMSRGTEGPAPLALLIVLGVLGWCRRSSVTGPTLR